MIPRRYRLEAALEKVSEKSQLRRPQKESLSRFHSLLSTVGGDLSGADQSELRNSFAAANPEWEFHENSVVFTVALATGVGKTRLIGALMAYLFLAKQSANFCLIAPRTEVVRKLIADCTYGSKKYIFGNDTLIPEPRVWHAENLELFREQRELDLTSGPNIFVLSPQSLVGDNRKAFVRSEFSGVSVVDYLRSCRDLIAFVDEAHHFGQVAEEDTSAWAGALRMLEPRFAVGLTATPRVERGANILYSYDLATCLREGLYTKAVRVIVRERPDSSSMQDWDWDVHVLDFALARLQRKAAALNALATERSTEPVKPVLLVCAEDTSHADQVGAWLVDSRGLKRDEVLVVHSKRALTDIEVQRLLQVESPTNPVRVIVNVQKLTEGWDVNNVFVIAPLRAMSTFTGAVQAMGRGLRLPYAKRLGEKEADTLDVLCFGRHSLQTILESALTEFGRPEDDAAGLEVRSAENEDALPPEEQVAVTVAPRISVEIHMPQARTVASAPELDFSVSDLAKLVELRASEFELGSKLGVSASDSMSFEYESFIKLCHARIFVGLRYLSALRDGLAVERLIKAALDECKCAPGRQVVGDWAMLAEAIKERIDQAYRKRPQVTVTSGTGRAITPGPAVVLVRRGEENALSVSASTAWRPNLYRRLLTGWNKSVMSACSFDGEPEYIAAKILDRDTSIEWWLRNEPPIVRLSTPIGYYEVDFTARLHDGSYVLLEIKGANFWKPPESDPRVKAAAATSWCKAVSTPEVKWTHIVVLDADISSCATVSDLAARSVQ
jgi:hypothetical protein